MSSNTSLRVAARAMAVSRVCAALQVPVAAEAALERFGETLRTLSPTGSALANATRKLPAPAVRALETLAGDRLTTARTMLEGAKGDRLATSRARVELAAAVAQAQRTLRVTSRQLLADDVVRFAVASGGTAETCSGPNVTAVTIAAGDHRTGVVRIADGEAVDIEWQGLQGSTCQDWTTALTADLAARGWEIAVDHEDFHGGGPGDGERLIRPAAARDPESLARGVVALAEEEIQAHVEWTRQTWCDEADDTFETRGELA